MSDKADDSSPMIPGRSLTIESHKTAAGSSPPDTTKSPIEKSGPQFNVWYWEYPIEGVNYIASADIARGDSGDYSTFHAINTKTMKISAEFKGKIPPDQFAVVVYDIARRFNNDDFPEFTSPMIDILKPSRIFSPIFWSSKIFLILLCTSLIEVWALFRTLSGRSSSAKSICASIYDSDFINFSLNFS